MHSFTEEIERWGYTPGVWLVSREERIAGEEVLAYAHQAGQVDPRSYAMLLEKVGQTTPDPAYAALAHAYEQDAA